MYQRFERSLYVEIRRQSSTVSKNVTRWEKSACKRRRLETRNAKGRRYRKPKTTRTQRGWRVVGRGEWSSIVYNVRLSSGRGLPPQKMQRCSDRDSDRERRAKRRGVNAALGVSRSSPLGLFGPSSALGRPSTAATTSSSAASRFPRPTVFFFLSFACASRGLREISPPRAAEQDGQRGTRGWREAVEEQEDRQ